MIHGALDGLDSLPFLENRGIENEVLSWIHKEARKASLGRHLIAGNEIHATVMEYDTVPRSDARFESHQEYIDLHCTLAGEEGIDFIPDSELVKDGQLIGDVQFWHAPHDGFTFIRQESDHYAVFFPGEAHRPQIQAGTQRVRKIVVKISKKYLVNNKT